ASPARTVPTEHPEAVADTARPEAPADPVARREAPPPAPDLGPLTTLCGRCVDEGGPAIAGLTADLLGWGGNDQRMNAWLANHARGKQLEQLEQKASTDADGAFRFRFSPPPPFQFRLRIHGEGRATWEDRWDELKPGATVDLGDLKLPA